MSGLSSSAMGRATLIELTTTVLLQASAGNFQDLVHNLGNQFIAATCMVMPAAGTYQNEWINGEGVITMIYLDENIIRVFNETAIPLAAGRVKIIVVG